MNKLLVIGLAAAALLVASGLIASVALVTMTLMGV